MSRTITTSKRPVWIAFGIAMLLHTGLISLQAGRRSNTSFVRTWLLDSLAPMEKLVDKSLYGITHVWGSYFALVGVRGENDQLKTKVNELQMELDQHRQEVLEAQRLRALLAIQDSGLGRTVVARVIGRDPTRANQTVTIDKGLSYGLKPDSAVITPDGIVGRVIQSSNFFSIVQLIVDSQAGVGVMLETSRRQGLLKGTGGRDLELEYIDDDNDLKEGDKFLTSGQDRIYPKGLSVGIILTLSPSRRGLFKSATIRPSVDLGRLEEVICILDHPQNADVLDQIQGPQIP